MAAIAVDNREALFQRIRRQSEAPRIVSRRSAVAAVAVHVETAVPALRKIDLEADFRFDDAVDLAERHGTALQGTLDRGQERELRP